MTPVTTEFKRRLIANDEQAWRELERDFGQFIVHGIRHGAGGAFHDQTVLDVRQEALRSLINGIGGYDPKRGASFSAWLFAFGNNAARNERARRLRDKRGSGRLPVSLSTDRAPTPEDPRAAPDMALFEARVFRAKVMRAVKEVQARVPHIEFQCYFLKITDGVQGKDLAHRFDLSPAAVTRHQQRVRDSLRREISRAVAEFSWVSSEEQELTAHGLDTGKDADFDNALGEVLHIGEIDAS